MGEADANIVEEFDGVSGAVGMAVVHLLDKAEVDQPFSAVLARQVGDEDDLGDVAGGVAVDHRVLFRMEAAAATWDVGVTAIR